MSKLRMSIQKNVSLKQYNSFGIEAKADLFLDIKSKDDLIKNLDLLNQHRYMFLGGGSNVLFIKDFNGLIIVNQLKGITAEPINQDEFKISVKSGELWHDLVLWTLDHGYFGLENMSLIPGTCGASPIQNIGAYGSEFKDFCLSVDAIHLETGEVNSFTNEECQFGYRESIFKRALSGQYFIYQIHLKLSKNSPINAAYGSIQDILKRDQIESPSHRDISNAVIEIRSSKLPLPQVLGNAGSFFKNPIVTQSIADSLLKEHPTAPNFKEDNGVKIPAGWLIEQCGFKGYRDGNVGSHKDQALVIVNYGGATGLEIYNYSEKIILSVQSKFGIVLEREVNMIQ